LDFTRRFFDASEKSTTIEISANDVAHCGVRRLELQEYAKIWFWKRVMTLV